MKKPLRIGIAGAGSIVRQRHWPGLRQIKDVHLAAVANSTPSSSAAFLNEMGLQADIESNWQTLVAREDLDIIWIGTHPHLHHPITVAALEACKHVFCQARMACDLEEACQMLTASEAHPRLVTMLCPPPYGLRQDAFIRRLLAQEIAGNVWEIHLQSLNGVFLDPTAPAHWRQRREISGCNVMTLGIYIEVLQRWFGDIEWVEAKGEIATPSRGNYRVEIPEKLSVNARFTSGMPAQLDFSNIHIGTPVESLTISGSTGILALDFLEETIELTPCGCSPKKLQTPSDLDRPWQVERDFIHAVRHPGQPRPHPTFRDGVAYMRVVQAVDEARLSNSRKFLEIPN